MVTITNIIIIVDIFHNEWKYNVWITCSNSHFLFVTF